MILFLINIIVENFEMYKFFAYEALLNQIFDDKTKMAT